MERSIMTWQNKLFSFQGRITRLDYWIYHLGIIFGVAGVAFVVALLGSVFGASDPADAAVVAAIVAGLICLWPLWAISVKRCHDRDKSGWWVLGWSIGGAIPYLGFLISIWSLVELGFLDGTQGSNRYGTSPKGIGDTQVSDVFS
jgi:uncharacterized membrane protein YhaH (DUF805 family)